MVILTIFSCWRLTLQAHSQLVSFLFFFFFTLIVILCFQDVRTDFELSAHYAWLLSIYHAHVGFHLMTCHGALIVEDAIAPPFKYDEELVLLFADYYHNLEQQITSGLDAVPFKWLGEPQSMVVNGNALGMGTCNPASPFGCSNNCHHHRISVKPGRTYRVRCVQFFLPAQKVKE